MITMGIFGIGFIVFCICAKFLTDAEDCLQSWEEELKLMMAQTDADLANETL